MAKPALVLCAVALLSLSLAACSQPAVSPEPKTPPVAQAVHRHPGLPSLTDVVASVQETVTGPSPLAATSVTEGRPGWRCTACARGGALGSGETAGCEHAASDNESNATAQRTSAGLAMVPRQPTVAV